MSPHVQDILAVESEIRRTKPIAACVPVLALLLSLLLTISPSVFAHVVRLNCMKRIEEQLLLRKYGDLRMFRHLFDAVHTQESVCGSGGE
ncbi:MAG: hypothetical protein ACOX4G_04165 [Limnochordia bacterium]|jgi:hypothetical protein